MTTRILPRQPVPGATERSSSGSSSGIIRLASSSRTVTASASRTPCLRTLAAALYGSHSNSTTIPPFRAYVYTNLHAASTVGAGRQAGENGARLHRKRQRHLVPPAFLLRGAHSRPPGSRKCGENLKLPKRGKGFPDRMLRFYGVQTRDEDGWQNQIENA